MAGTSMVRVNTSSLLGDANQISAEINGIKASVKKMYDDVETLGTMWKGRANTAFTNQFKQDYKSFTEFLTTLEKFAANLEDDSNAYENCENKVVNLAQSI